jgi:hypothetical protein
MRKCFKLSETTGRLETKFWKNIQKIDYFYWSAYTKPGKVSDDVFVG